MNGDWQSRIAATLAVIAGLWAAWKILTPLVNEFRKKKSPDAGCGACGCGSKPELGTCGSAKNIEPKI